jgi:hypothetical protein
MMLKRKEWKEFQDAGLLWWVNRILHTFGWAIVVVQEDDGEVTAVYPARCKFRGFGLKNEEEGFKKISAYMLKEAKQLNEEAQQ